MSRLLAAVLARVLRARGRHVQGPLIRNVVSDMPCGVSAAEMTTMDLPPAMVRPYVPPGRWLP